MKPIHKFNNGNLATLCRQCSVIITTGLTDDLYCKECNKYRKELLQEIMKEDEDLGLYIEQMEKEEPKQETLEEAAERFYNTEDLQRDCTFIEGAKWQQEQDKKLYSEEEVFEIVLKARTECYVLSNSETKDWLFEQFKKK
jgi:hypothetical protein